MLLLIKLHIPDDCEDSFHTRLANSLFDQQFKD